MEHILTCWTCAPVMFHTDVLRSQFSGNLIWTAASPSNCDRHNANRLMLNRTQGRAWSGKETGVGDEGATPLDGLARIVQAGP